VGIEGKCIALPAALEQGKGGGVDVAPVLVVVALEDLPGAIFGNTIDVDEVDRATGSKTTASLDGLVATDPHHQSGVGLGEDVVGAPRPR